MKNESSLRLSTVFALAMLLPGCVAVQDKPSPGKASRADPALQGASSQGAFPAEGWSEPFQVYFVDTMMDCVKHEGIGDATGLQCPSARPKMLIRQYGVLLHPGTPASTKALALQMRERQEAGVDDAPETFCCPILPDSSTHHRGIRRLRRGGEAGEEAAAGSVQSHGLIHPRLRQRIGDALRRAWISPTWEGLEARGKGEGRCYGLGATHAPRSHTRSPLQSVSLAQPAAVASALGCGSGAA